MESNRLNNLQRLQELALLDTAPPRDPAKYTGDLGRPLRKDQVPAEYRNRWKLLYEWHGVQDGDLDGLLTKLVETHVPGFRMARSGRPATRQRARALAGALANVGGFALEQAQMPRRPAGRPRALTFEEARAFVSAANDWKAGQLRAGNSKDSDRGFVMHE